MSSTQDMTYIAAITEALDVELARDPEVIIFGEDVAGPFGGAFKVTKPLTDKYPPERIFNTPMCENAFISMGTGMALMGMRPVIEMQFADFISSGFDSIVQFAATNHYRWRAPVPWVIRAPCDGGLRSGPFHSQNPEAWFTHSPGLKVVAPGTPADAKGLLIAAIRDNNPVIYMESKILYRSERGPVPEGEYIVPIGEAHIARNGADLSIVTYGAQVREAQKAAGRLNEEGIEAEILDLRTLKPLDTAAILESARKTGKVLIVHSATGNTGVGAEVAALIAQEAFEWLDAPIQRLTGLDIPVPFSPTLEDAYRPSADKIYAREGNGGVLNMANHGLKLATLCYVQRPGQTLMLHRVKRANDYHEGKWNGLGGKFEQGESPEECVAREVYEESGLVCVDPALRGQITFPNFDGQADWYVWLFLAQHWTGQLRESPEGSLAWIDNDRLLDLNLWPGDRLFIPWMFEDRYFSAKFLYHDGDFQGYQATFYSPGGRIDRESYEHKTEVAAADFEPAYQPADDTYCWLCDGAVSKRHCKIICLQCGFTRDCSDP